MVADTKNKLVTPNTNSTDKSRCMMMYELREENAQKYEIRVRILLMVKVRAHRCAYALIFERVLFIPNY